LRRKKIDFGRIKLLVLDVDGVLTDGTLVINADGREIKFFNTLDGHGIRMWRRAGLKVAFLSGRVSEPTVWRAKDLEVDFCFEDCHSKLPVLEELAKQQGLLPEEIAYVGDDLMDLPAMRYAGFSAAVANAVEEVKGCADYVTARSGGDGAVREVIEYILKSSGRWEKLIEKYIS
jgi:3-deoxy-D-manno-octulosonate 8-phosphate phosphatase (KDO 8-P phosphatase)